MLTGHQFQRLDIGGYSLIDLPLVDLAFPAYSGVEKAEISDEERSSSRLSEIGDEIEWMFSIRLRPSKPNQEVNRDPLSVQRLKVRVSFFAVCHLR